MTLSTTPVQVDYGKQIERELKELGEAIAQTPELAEAYNPRWLAIQLLEGDETLLAEVAALNGNAPQILEASIERLEQIYGEDVDVMLADCRYNFVNTLVQGAVTRSTAAGALTASDKIDKIVTHRWLGIPIFLVLMWAVFKITTDVAAPYLDWVDGVVTGPVSNRVVSLLGLIGLEGTWVESLFVDGILAGVGGVLVFVPVLMSLYLALAVLEDSGYMARAAFVMDRLMSVIGLHGKSFLPMVVGFGCTVPAIYATRTLKSEKDRILTGLLVPFMSCSARLPVYILFAAIFFPRYGGLVVFSLYLLGILTAIALGLILKSTLFKGKEQTPFVMELPPYRVPNPKSVWSYMWERTASFIQNAWTIILATSIVIWILMAIPMGGGGKFADTDVNQSAFATVSGAIAPLLKPLGFNSWQASGSLITGFVAKEVVVSTMAQVYGVAEAAEAAETTTFIQDAGQVATSFISATVDTLKSIPLIVGINLFDEEAEEEPGALMKAIHAGFEATSDGHAALAAFAFLVFVLIYTPCMVAVAAARHEFGVRWMWFSVIGQLVLAWLMAFVIFQGGKLLGFG
ncbi:MAG: ferrous iron transport protein B [Anaerolineaceae bacterium 4572_5.2]|nr:MAG: ferrous iron transport protein B [Anaerolineaceae bacterium 4572_5.2]